MSLILPLLNEYLFSQKVHNLYKSSEIPKFGEVDTEEEEHI